MAGGTGRLGARIVRELLLKGFNVRAGVRNVERAQGFVDTAAAYGILPGNSARRIKLLPMDLADEESIAAAIGNAGRVGLIQLHPDLQCVILRLGTYQTRCNTDKRRLHLHQSLAVVPLLHQCSFHLKLRSCQHSKVNKSVTSCGSNRIGLRNTMESGTQAFEPRSRSNQSQRCSRMYFSAIHMARTNTSSQTDVACVHQIAILGAGCSLQPGANPVHGTMQAALHAEKAVAHLAHTLTWSAIKCIVPGSLAEGSADTNARHPANKIDADSRNVSSLCLLLQQVSFVGAFVGIDRHQGSGKKSGCKDVSFCFAGCSGDWGI